MKMIYITCNVSVKERVMEELEECGVRDFQILDHAEVKNKLGVPRYDTEVWPGFNVVFMMQISEAEKVEAVLQQLRRFNKEMAFNETELLTVCSWPLEEYFFD